MGGAVVLVMGPSSPQGPIRHVGYAVPRQISCRGRAPSGRSQIESEGGPAARWKPRRATVPDVFARSTEGARPRLIVVLLFLALLGGILPSASARAADPLSSRIAAARDRQASLRDSMARQERLIADLMRRGNVRASLHSTNEHLDGIGDDLRALRRDIKRATQALERQRRRGEALREELRQLDTILALLDLEIGQGAEDLEARRQAFGRRLADSQRTQQTSVLQQVLEGGSFADVMTNASAYEAYAAQDAEEARLIEQDQRSLDSMRALQATTRHRTDQLGARPMRRPWTSGNDASS